MFELDIQFVVDVDVDPLDDDPRDDVVSGGQYHW
jgi:hypothetical protein